MESKLIYGPPTLIQLPKIGFYLEVVTSEGDGDHPKTERFFLKQLRDAVEDYMLLQAPDVLKKSDPDKWLDYIGRTNVGMPRDLDYIKIVEVFMLEEQLAERFIHVQRA